MTAKELDDILIVARKHRVTAITVDGMTAHLEYPETFDTQPSDAVINAGGWKRRPNLEE